MAVSERDVLRKAVRFLKNKYKIEISRVELNSIDSCYNALDRCVYEANKESINKAVYKLCEDYRKINLNLRLENVELKHEIEKLRSKRSLLSRIFG